MPMCAPVHRSPRRIHESGPAEGIHTDVHAGYANMETSSFLEMDERRRRNRRRVHARFEIDVGDGLQWVCVQQMHHGNYSTVALSPDDHDVDAVREMSGYHSLDGMQETGGVIASVVHGGLYSRLPGRFLDRGRILL